MAWQRFWIETNLRWGWQDTEDDWHAAVKGVASLLNEPEAEAERYLLRSRAHPRTKDSYGLYAEYTGTETLADFFKDRGMRPLFQET